MRKLPVLVTVFSVFMLLFCAASPSKIKLVVATDASWPPMEFVNDQGEIVGYDIDLMKTVAEKAGFDVEFRNVGWDKIFAGLNRGDYQAVISSVSVSQERMKTMDFSTPYINAGQVLIVRYDDGGIETLANLAGKKVGAQIGTTGELEIRKVKACIPKTYDEISLAIEDLACGKIDGVVADTPIALNYTVRDDKYSTRLKIAGKPFTMEFYAIAIKKDDKKTQGLINRGLKTVLSDRKILDALSKKWLR